MHKLRKHRGFTLVELIVVIAIMAILTSVSISGYEYSQKRAAIENDKALVKQLNQVLDSHGVFTHNDKKISEALIEEFGKNIEIQSLEFGYDIYCNKDICEFDLLQKSVYDKNNNYKSLANYLNYTEQIVMQSFNIKSDYFKEYSDNNKTTRSYINITNPNTYHLEVDIFVIHNEDQSFSSYPHTILFSELITTNEGFTNVNLTYSLEVISEVIYDNYNYKNEIIENKFITFYYQGTYKLNISDGNTNKTINIVVYNIEYDYEKSYLTPSSSTKNPTRTHNGDGTYDVYLPIFFYLNIHDYRPQELQYISYEWNNYDSVERNKLIENGRLLIKINDQFCAIKNHNQNHCVLLSNLNIGEHIYDAVYYYQGYNGRWYKLIQTFVITINENGTVTLSKS